MSTTTFHFESFDQFSPFSALGPYRAADYWQLPEGAPIELIRGRMAARRHRYMPAALLESQFATLEPPADAIDIDISEAPERCVELIRAALRG